MAEEITEEVFTVQAEDSAAGMRLDAFWFACLATRGISRGRIQEWIKAGRARIDGADCRKSSTRLSGGERLELFPERPRSVPAPEAGGLRIVYEDGQTLVVDKPPGLTVHPAPSCPEGTLVNRLLHHYPGLRRIGGERPGVVHRIDKDTSGLLLIALTEAAKNRLSADFAERRVEKTYLALVWGVPEKEAGVIDAPMGRDPGNKTRMAVVKKGGRIARSAYKTVWRAPDGRVSLVEVGISTGRTHQIRVHMTHLGHPLVGDAVYGPRQAAQLKKEDGPIARLAGRQMLHAWKLAFTHPATGERKAFTLPPPKDFWRLILLFARKTQRVGVTGMAGGGKSAFCRFVEQAGYPVFSADRAVAALYEPGGHGSGLLASRYGERFLDGAGGADKAGLFAAMKENGALRREIMDMIHPLVLGMMEDFYAEKARSRAVFAEIPLLFESGWPAREHFDLTIGVRSKDADRRERLALARGWSQETAAVMDSWQWPEEKKLALCDLVVDNVATLDALRAETARTLTRLQAMRRNSIAALFARLRKNGYAGPAGNAADLPHDPA